MQQLPPALAAMAAYRQFIVCQLVPDPEHPGKTFKYPLNVWTGHPPRRPRPGIWLDAAQACQIATAWGAGYCVGFTFTEQDPFFFVDVDNCLDPATGLDPDCCGAVRRAAWRRVRDFPIRPRPALFRHRHRARRSPQKGLHE
jgi:primase-polymerase (primpol)-like protein